MPQARFPCDQGDLISFLLQLLSEQEVSGAGLCLQFSWNTNVGGDGGRRAGAGCVGTVLPLLGMDLADF